MKPTPDIRNRCDSITQAMPTNWVFPKNDCNYQATILGDLNRQCGGCGKASFRTISQDYFAKEAPQHFAHEAVLFFMMMITAALPLLKAAIAVLELTRP